MENVVLEEASSIQSVNPKYIIYWYKKTVEPKERFNRFFLEEASSIQSVNPKYIIYWYKKTVEPKERFNRFFVGEIMIHPFLESLS